jgi:hypothetical protein
MVRSLEVRAAFLADGNLAIAYLLRGDMARLLVPQESAPGRRDQLWEHTCFEAFVGIRNESAYREFNFSPAGDWAAYAFADYRQRDESVALDVAPQIASRLFAGRIEVDVVVSRETLPRTTEPLQIGLSAVVEAADTIDGRHSYWALRHPAARPDFHHRDGFLLELTLPHNFS